MAVTHHDPSDLRRRALRSIPGGVNSNVRLGVADRFFSHAQGAWLYDVQGRDFVDYLLGQGPNFLGHAHPAVTAAVEAAIRQGILFAAQTPVEVKAAEAVLDAVGWAEQLRFGLTGNEMVQTALRVARAATGRQRFIRFEGHYHGWMDNVLTGLTVGAHGPMSAGQLEGPAAEGVLLPWNDLEVVADALAANNDIAAILTEPMMVNNGAILPAEGYLQGLRDLCDQHGVLLIFDEVITGFRLSMGGAASRFGVHPDLATYGKAMAGGFPVAALAGTAKLLEGIGTGAINHSGTFNGNAMGAAATLAAIRVLREEGVHEQVEKYGSRLIDELRALSDHHGLPLHFQGLPMAFHASFGPREPIRSLRDLADRDADRYAELTEALHQAGVWVAARGIWYVSAAHGERELQQTLERVDAAMRQMG